MFFRFLLLITLIFASFAFEGLSPSCVNSILQSSTDIEPPFINGSLTFHEEKFNIFKLSNSRVFSPILNISTNLPIEIGSISMMDAPSSLSVLDSAKLAWNSGKGIWPQLSPYDRIHAIENFVQQLSEKREEIIQILTWEICKSTSDATSEFDRTMTFVSASIASYRESLSSSSSWSSVGGLLARVRRTALGIILCLGPFNYPFNETYAALIPALLTGNIVILKLPSLGGLAHILTLQAFASALPKGTVHFLTGSGRDTLPPIMSTGGVDALAFIGGSKTADFLIKSHPHPHKLKLFLQLEGKNLGVVFPDADLPSAVREITLGSTSFNGQRCTAIKLIFVHRSISSQFLDQFVDSVSGLKAGLPWEEGVSITPLPEPNKTQYLRSLIRDATDQGATIINAHQGGGEVSGNLMFPAIVFPVTANMRLWREEQFGPVIPVATYDSLSEIEEYFRDSRYGQQTSLFTQSSSPTLSEEVADLINFLSTNVGRVNLNTQCSRSPDSLPFSGRKSSALGTMSVSEALLAFSVESVLATKNTEENAKIVTTLEGKIPYLSNE